RTSESDDFPSELVSWDQRKTRGEIPFVNVQIGAAEAAGIDSNQNVVGFDLRFGHFLVFELPWCVVDDCFHVEKKSGVQCSYPDGIKLRFSCEVNPAIASRREFTSRPHWPRFDLR